jgi:hypothetical protein
MPGGPARGARVARPRPSLPLVVAWALLGVVLEIHQIGPGQTGVSMVALSYPTWLRGQRTGFSFGIGRAGSVVGS